MLRRDSFVFVFHPLTLGIVVLTSTSVCLAHGQPDSLRPMPSVPHYVGPTATENHRGFGPMRFSRVPFVRAGPRSAGTDCWPGTRSLALPQFMT